MPRISACPIVSENRGFSGVGAPEGDCGGRNGRDSGVWRSLSESLKALFDGFVVERYAGLVVGRKAESEATATMATVVPGRTSERVEMSTVSW